MADPARPIAPWRRKAASAVPWLLAAFLAGVALQVFLAGAALLSGLSIEAHKGFAHVVELFPLLLILAGFVGGDRRAGIVGIVLAALFWLQYAFIHASPGLVRALHPTNALALFGVAFWLLLRRLPWGPARGTDSARP